MTKKYGLLLKPDGDITAQAFREMVAVNAYYRAEKRGFATGYDTDDWRDAELEMTLLHPDFNKES